MRKAVLKGAGNFVVGEVPDPVPVRDEVLVRVKYCGVCGSDLHIYAHGAGVGAGHEFSGDIAALGSDVTGWAVGDRVTVEPRISCGECFWCRRGDLGLCEQYYVRLLEYEGAFATYAKTESSQLHRLPRELSYERAALIEPTACAVQAIRLSGMQEGDAVAVLGLGPIGQLVARVARVRGARAVYAAEISRSRADLAGGVADEVVDANADDPVARILGLTGGIGPDVVFECAGNATTTLQAVDLVRKGGTVVIAGICFDWVEMPVSNIVLRGLTIRGSIIFSPDDYASAFNLIEEGRIDVDPLITRKMPLADINEAFDISLRGEGGKILIEP
jgi:L-iditol 2-dehydrogenase